MKSIHNPRVDFRYWTAILLASVFGTNLGDFYAHESHLGIVKGLAVLAVVVALAFIAERFDSYRHQAYYWLVIILIRTGATNIADYLAYRVRVPELALTLGLAALIALFGWGTRPATRPQNGGEHALPGTNAWYWLAMLSAGVFGTVVGDICEHAVGDGLAALLLTALFALALAAMGKPAVRIVAIYWLIVTVARTAGTAIGDWLAESKALHIGLPLSTLLSGIAFVAVLVFWKSRTAPLLHET